MTLYVLLNTKNNQATLVVKGIAKAQYELQAINDK